MRRAPGSRARGLRDDSGMALVTVIGLVAVLTIVSIVALTFANNAQRPARQHQDWNAALAAAEAGLDDYLARLNRDTSYWVGASAEDPQGNDALDPSRWAEMPDATGYYHYVVDSSRTASEGIVVVRSTGYVNGRTRTIEAGFRPAGFLDYIYFTDLELPPPNIVPTTSCIFEHYVDLALQGIDRDDACIAIRFTTGDVFDGPVRSNDRLMIDGNPTFLGPVRTWRYVDPDTGEYWFDFSAGGVSQPDFQHPDGIDGPGVTKFNLPKTNQEIKNKTSEQDGGCLYHGPTYIRFMGDELRVRSPLSTRSNVPAPNPNCFSGDLSSLASSAGTIVDMTDESFNGVIYVEETDWNAAHADLPGSTPACDSDNHPLGLPQAGVTAVFERAAPDEYDCDAGDVFLWGEIDGQVTVAAKRDIHVIWDTTYVGNFETGSDLLGLIADRDVKVRHPVSTWQPPTSGGGFNRWAAGPHADIRPFPPGDGSAASSTNTVWEDPEIHAAIVALNGTFTVQNFHRGQAFTNGKLTVRGAIAQKYRGPVGMGTTTTLTRGYLKDYRYDDRLQYLSPPHFISPEDSEWVLRFWGELREPDDLPPPPP